MTNFNQATFAIAFLSFFVFLILFAIVLNFIMVKCCGKKTWSERMDGADGMGAEMNEIKQ